MPLRVPRFVLGGPSYRQQVHVRHQESVVQLSRASMLMERDGMLVAEMGDLLYRHSSNLPQVRCILLREAMAMRDVKWFVSVDSDTTFDAVHLLAELRHVDGQTAIGLAPVRQGGTGVSGVGVVNLNLTSDDERRNVLVPRDKTPVRMVADELKRVLDGDRLIESGGFGVAVFNLDWYRNVWPAPMPEMREPSIDTGEDLEHCWSVKSRGGLIKVLRVQTDHFAHGESQLR